MIKYITGNLIEQALAGKYDIILHGCNCQCIMDKGIALQISKAFTEAYIADKQTKCGDVYKLGDYSYAYNKNLRLKIVNLYTQYKTGPYFEYAAFGLSIRNLATSLRGDEVIAMPMIGAGLGGGDWIQIEKIIKHELSEYDITIIKYKYDK